MVNNKRKKHNDVFTNPIEARKLQKMNEELQTSKELVEIPSHVEQFETETNNHFNKSINQEYIKSNQEESSQTSQKD